MITFQHIGSTRVARLETLRRPTILHTARRARDNTTPCGTLYSSTRHNSFGTTKPAFQHGLATRFQIMHYLQTLLAILTTRATLTADCTSSDLSEDTSVLSGDRVNSTRATHGDYINSVWPGPVEATVKENIGWYLVDTVLFD